MRAAINFNPELLDSPSAIVQSLWAQLAQGFMIAMPLFAGSIVLALAGPLLLGGWNLSIESIQPDFSRVNPLSGFGRIFSSTGVFETIKSLLKITLLGGLASLLIWRNIDHFTALGYMDVGTACGEAGVLSLKIFEWLAGGLAIIAAIDAPYQKWTHIKKLKMSRQEVRDEAKESEGRPEIKAKIRRLQQEMSQRRMMENIPGADVVVTNPTHYAVALRYTSSTMRAPKVVAKGRGEIALAIRELARANKVPLLEAPPLARALYRSVELDQEIPADLYAAVATVLTYLYQLRQARGGEKPAPPSFDKLPGGEPDMDQPP
jgi:flagellar biosynthetic protein FlhB